MPSDINQRLGFEAGGAIKTLRSLAKALGTAATAMNAFSKSAGNFNGSTGGFDAALKNLNTQIKKTSDSLRTLGESFKKIPAGVKPATQQTSKFRKALQGLVKMSIRVLIIQTITRAIRQFAQSVLRGIEEARKFGLAIAEIETISGGMTGTTASLTRNVLALSEAYGRSAQQVAEGVYQTISNQIEGASDAFGVLSTAMKLAATTASQPKDAINAISSVLNSYSLDVSHAAEVSDILFKTVELGRLRLSEIADIIGRVTPLSAKLGISFKETAAAIAVMTRQGVKANTAVTQLRAVEQKLIKPTEKMVELFRKWGVEDGATAIKTFGGLTGVLKKMSKEVEGNDAEMAEFFSRVRAIVGEMSLMTKEGQLMVDTLAEMDDAMGVVNSTWAKFLKSDAQQMTNATEKLKNAYLRAGKALQGWYITWIKIKVIVANVTAAILGSLNSLTRKLMEAKAIIDEAGREAKEKRAEINPIPSEAELNRSLEGFRQGVAKAQADHNNLYDKMENRVDAFAAGASKRLKGVFKELEGQLSVLRNFIDTFDAVNAEISGDIQSLKDEQSIDKSKNRGKGSSGEINARLKIAERSAEEGIAAIKKGINEDDRKTGRQKLSYAMQQLKAAKQLATSSGDSSKALKVQRTIESLRGKQIKAEELMLTKREGAYEYAVETEGTLTDQIANRDKLVDQLIKAYKDFDSVFDPDKRDALKEKIDDLNAQLRDFNFEGVDQSLLEALNIEFVAQKFTSELDAELDKIQMDWTKMMLGVGDAFTQELRKAARELNLEVKVKALVDSGKLDVSKGIAQAGNSDELVKNYNRSLTLERQLKDASRDRFDAESKAFKANKALVQETHDLRLSAEAKSANDAGFYRSKLEALMNLALEQGTLTKAQGEELDVLATKIAANTDSNFANAKEQLGIYIGAIRDAQTAGAKIKPLEVELNTDKIKEAKDSFQSAAVTSKELTDKSREGKEQIKGQAKAAKDGTTQINRQKQAEDGFKGAANQGTQAMQAQGVAIDTNTKKLKTMEQQAIRTANAIAAANSGGSAKHFGGVQHLASGGLGQDTVSAMLTPGEFVVNKASTSKFFSDLSAINSGSKPIYREQGGDVTNVGDVNVTVNGGSSSQETVREIGYALKRELRRGTLNL